MCFDKKAKNHRSVCHAKSNNCALAPLDRYNALYDTMRYVLFSVWKEVWLLIEVVQKIFFKSTT